MCPNILVVSLFFMASLIRKSYVDISTHRQEGVKSECTIRHFQQEKALNRGLLFDCEIFAKVRFDL